MAQIIDRIQTMISFRRKRLTTPLLPSLNHCKCWLARQKWVSSCPPTAGSGSLNSPPVPEGMRALRSGDSNHQSRINSHTHTQMLSSSARLVKVSQATEVLLWKTHRCGNSSQGYGVGNKSATPAS